MKYRLHMDNGVVIELDVNASHYPENMREPVLAEASHLRQLFPGPSICGVRDGEFMVIPSARVISVTVKP